MSEQEQPAKMSSYRSGNPLPRTLLLGIATALCPLSSPAQTSTPPPIPPDAAPALVTFFSNPISFMAGFPGRRSDGFKGRLFVDDDQLAKIRPGRFVTISFIPGTYKFTANTWMASGPNGGAHLGLDLAPHHHYYVELRTRESFPVTKMFGIKEISCEEAVRNNARDKPLDPAALKLAGKSNLLTEGSFPSCPGENKAVQPL